MDRRGFLVGTVGGALIGGASAAKSAEFGAPEVPPGAKWYPVPEDPTKVQGHRTDGGYGVRSQFASEVRWLDEPAYAAYGVPGRVQSSMTPLQTSQGIVTPSGLHFERHHAGIPTIDPDRHRLLVHGMVNSAMIFSVADLIRYPSISRCYFVECSGNTARGYSDQSRYEAFVKDWATAGVGVQQSHGLTSTSEWTGVPLRTILEEVGLRDGAHWVIAEGADAAKMSRSIPIEKCLDDALLAYGQNGEALRPEQGFPLRLLLPGFEGNANVKWLRRLYVTDRPFFTREETSRYSDLKADGKARLFSFVMNPKSVITYPSHEVPLSGPGAYELSGLAWSGYGRVKQVLVSTDFDGTRWQPAQLQEPVLSKCHTRFRFPWHWDGSATRIRSRCLDDFGNEQPIRAELIEERGHNFGYHYNAVQTWHINENGTVEDARV